MSVIRIVGLIGIVLTVLPSAAPNEPRKEHIRLRVATQSSAPAQARLITRGLILLTPGPTGRQPWQVMRTFSVPTELALGGVGEADLVSVDSAVVLVVDAVQVRSNPPPAIRIIGSAIRISRSPHTEVFQLAPLASGRARRVAAQAIMMSNAATW
jgi:hypothetical protein